MIKLNETVTGYTRKNKTYIVNRMKDATVENPFTFYILTCNVAPNDSNMWISPFKITVDKIYFSYDDAITTINEYEYYNCGQELGKTVNFYIKEEV